MAPDFTFLLSERDDRQQFVLPFYRNICTKMEEGPPETKDECIAVETPIDESISNLLSGLRDEETGRVYRIPFTGFRPPSTKAPKYYDRTRKMLVSNEEFQGINGTLANAFAVFGDVALAKLVLEKCLNRSHRSLRDMAKFIEREVRTYKLVPYDDVLHNRPVEIDWLLTKLEGVALVLVYGSETVIHIVCIDGRKKLIYDCVEACPMTLCGAVRCCVGDGSEITRINVRQLVRISYKHKVGTKRKLGSRQRKRRKLRLEKEAGRLAEEGASSGDVGSTEERTVAVAVSVLPTAPETAVATPATECTEENPSHKEGAGLGAGPPV